MEKSESARIGVPASVYAHAGNIINTPYTTPDPDEIRWLLEDLGIDPNSFSSEEEMTDMAITIAAALCNAIEIGIIMKDELTSRYVATMGLYLRMKNEASTRAGL